MPFLKAPYLSQTLEQNHGGNYREINLLGVGTELLSHLVLLFPMELTL